MPDLKLKRQKKELSFEEFVEGLRAIGLSAGDTVLVQSSFIPFRHLKGGPRAVLEALLTVLQPNGTLIMPTFNWRDFGEKKFYSKRHSKPQTGILSELLMDWEGCRRIYHPLHGFSLVGNRAEELCRKVKNKSSFDRSSLFAELRRRNAKILLLGVHYSQGFTFFHYIEESVGVPYRKFITLRGNVEELDGSVHEAAIPYYGRASMDIHYQLDKVQPILEAPGSSLVTEGKIGIGTVKIMRAGEVYERLAPILRTHPNLVLTDQI